MKFKIKISAIGLYSFVVCFMILIILCKLVYFQISSAIDGGRKRLMKRDLKLNKYMLKGVVYTQMIIIN